MYVFSAYITEYHFNERDSEEGRRLIRIASEMGSPGLALVEVACLIRRHVLEGWLSDEQGRELPDFFGRQGGGGFEW